MDGRLFEASKRGQYVATIPEVRVSVIGLKLGRSESSIYAKASEMGLSLKPTNQSPFSRRDEDR